MAELAPFYPKSCLDYHPDLSRDKGSGVYSTLTHLSLAYLQSVQSAGQDLRWIQKVRGGGRSPVQRVRAQVPSGRNLYVFETGCIGA
jgi:hypothetical protein